jgi:hypothetical protein
LAVRFLPVCSAAWQSIFVILADVPGGFPIEKALGRFSANDNGTKEARKGASRLLSGCKQSLHFAAILKNRFKDTTSSKPSARPDFPHHSGGTYNESL